MKNKKALQFAVIILIACNMRAPFTGVGALASLIREELMISNTVTGLLTTIPMLAFAIVSLIAPALSRRIGLVKSISVSLIMIFAGEMIRSFAGTFGLFAGTAVLCCGIAIENVLLISVVKQWFPEDPAPATSAYSTTMAVMAAVSIGLSVFLAVTAGLGWRGALAIWAVFAAAAFFFWTWVSGRSAIKTAEKNSGENVLKQMLKSSRIWFLMAFFGAQALLFYSMTAWCPTILQAKGFSLEQASKAATFLQIAGLPITLLAPLLAKRFTAKRVLIVLCICYLTGGILFFNAVDPVPVYISLLLYAQGMGSTFSFALLFFASQGRNPEETALISGIVQSGGYIIAAVGPVLMGAFADLTGSWQRSVLFLIILIGAVGITGAISSKEGTILSERH